MNQEKIILIELQEVAPALAGCSKQMPFEMPEGYFETFPLMMLESVVPAPKDESTVPAGYFNSFPELMMQKLRAQEVMNETESIAPLLNTISKTMPHHVPEGYFEKMQPAVSSTATVVTIKPKMWMQIAAAILVMLATFSLWQISQKKASISSEVANNYATDTIAIPVEITMQLALMDESAIETAFGTTGQSIDASNGVYFLETENFEEALKEFDVDELATLINETPIPKKTI